jgi:hypothetical protein
MNNQLLFSQKGQVVLTGTTAAATSNYFAMQVIADAVVASMTWIEGYGATGDWSDLTVIPAGAVLCGRFNTLTLTSGEVILHKENA